jgi:hypothetical protein
MDIEPFSFLIILYREFVSFMPSPHTEQRAVVGSETVYSTYLKVTSYPPYTEAEFCLGNLWPYSGILQRDQSLMIVSQINFITNVA